MTYLDDLEKKFFEALESAKDTSYVLETTMWVMSNGEDIMIAHSADERDEARENGYWVAAIFEDGHQVEA